MTNWRTTLGGALEGLGAGIRDLATISALVTINGPTYLTKIHIGLILTGSILSLIGKFFSNLFAADAKAVQQQLELQSKAIASNKSDTEILRRDVNL